MMGDIVLRADGISKKFCRTLKHTMLYGSADIARSFFGLDGRSERLRGGEFWAVDDISFELKRGEVLGMIGTNGAGKTSILKMLNGIFMPDKGRVEVDGRMGALISVGAGFHPMLTGRENVYINGSILGMTKREIDSKFDEIVDFSEVGEFIDSPVKHYSSGMFVRLGFAVASHCEPEILLIDEVLAVGDMNFQRKCFNHIRTFLEGGGSAIIVSHNLPTLAGLCNKVLWLEDGRFMGFGESAEIIGRYIDSQNKRESVGEGGRESLNRWGSGEMAFTEMRIKDGEGNEKKEFSTKDSIHIEIEYKVNKEVNDPRFWLTVKDMVSDTLVTCACSGTNTIVADEGKSGKVTFAFDISYLRPRRYALIAEIIGPDAYAAYDRWLFTDFIVKGEDMKDESFVPGQNDVVSLPFKVDSMVYGKDEVVG